MQDEIAAVVEACGDATLKVILEVSELETYDNIRAASFLAMRGDCAKATSSRPAPARPRSTPRSATTR